MKFVDLTGRKFGHLTVIERAEKKNGKNRWKCLCECGNYTYTITNRLLQGKTRSCGCVRRLTVTHGMSDTRLYSIWCGMKKRCHNKNDSSYKRYGAKGIKVCEKWRNDFMSFYEWAIHKQGIFAG